MRRFAIFLSAILAALLLAAPSAAHAATTARDSASISISSFSVTQNSENDYEASWSLLRAYSGSEVTLYLTTDTYSNTGMPIISTETSAKGSTEFELYDIDPGYYHFLLEATGANGSTAYAYTKDAFFIENSYRAEKLENVIAARNEEQAFMTWDGDGDVIVYLYDDDTKELLLARNVNSKPCSIDIPAGHENICAGAAAVSDGLAGNFTPVQCSMKNVPVISVSFENTSVTNVPEFGFSIDRSSGDTLRVFRERTEIEEETPGSGYFVVPLSEGTNEIMIFASDRNGRTAVTQHEVTLDTKAPALTLIETAKEFSTVRDTVYIKGKTERDAIVVCDYEEIPLVGENFSIKKQLAYGENTIDLLSVDEAGNESAVTLTVTRSFWSKDHIYAAAVIGIGAAAAAAEIFYLMLRRRWRKKK